MLQHCFAVELRKSFVDYETSPDFTSAWLWVDKDWLTDWQSVALNDFAGEDYRSYIISLNHVNNKQMNGQHICSVLESGLHT